MKHIHKYALEGVFFKLIVSENEIKKTDTEGVPTITWQEDEKTVTTWLYETEEQRDNDYNVVINASFERWMELRSLRILVNSLDYPFSLITRLPITLTRLPSGCIY